jgi:hypothetical protein
LVWPDPCFLTLYRSYELKLNVSRKVWDTKVVIRSHYLRIEGQTLKKFWIKKTPAKQKKNKKKTNEQYKRISFQVTKQMAQELGIQIYDWGYNYSSTFSGAKNTKHQNFQFKLSHIITATTCFLFKCGLEEALICTFGAETKESILDLFLGMQNLQYQKRTEFT